jgi:hypothetical protein
MINALLHSPLMTLKIQVARASSVIEEGRIEKETSAAGGSLSVLRCSSQRCLCFVVIVLHSFSSIGIIIISWIG